MVTVKTAAGKKALAETLKEVHEESLEDLRMLAGVFGPMESVAWELEDPEKQAKLDAGMERARKAHGGKVRAAASTALGQMKKATGPNSTDPR